MFENFGSVVLVMFAEGFFGEGVDMVGDLGGRSEKERGGMVGGKVMGGAIGAEAG